ncbi:hypothetical protein NOVOSPHI9U_30036 [Novosphingobium sp. 9U]|nr:hypothetical protein NOVOSPHI9U_30036 [Novosphingobium sp. 9U]
MTDRSRMGDNRAAVAQQAAPSGSSGCLGGGERHHVALPLRCDIGSNLGALRATDKLVQLDHPVAQGRGSNGLPALISSYSIASW